MDDHKTVHGIGSANSTACSVRWCSSSSRTDEAAPAQQHQQIRRRSTHDLVELRLGVLRAQLRRGVQRRAELDGCDALHGPLHELFVDGFLDQGAGGARAHLHIICTNHNNSDADDRDVGGEPGQGSQTVEQCIGREHGDDARPYYSRPPPTSPELNANSARPSRALSK